MSSTHATDRTSARRLMAASMAAIAALSATALAVGPRGEPGEAAGSGGVVSVRRGSSAGSGSVGVMRSGRPVRVEGRASGREGGGTESLGLSSSGSITPDGGSLGGVTDEVLDTDPIGAGLPDAIEGEPDVVGVHGEEITFVDISVRGKRSGRTILLVGAEVAFANCDIEVVGGTALGFSGVMGPAGPNPGSAPAVEFTLQSGGEITLTVQPASSGSPSAPNRPMRTITMMVP